MPSAVRVAIPVFDGVEELDAIGPLEVFGTAERAGFPVNVRLVSRVASVRAAHGVVFAGLEPLPADSALIVVPGGEWLSSSDGGVRAAIRDAQLLAWLCECHARGAVLASVCTGVFLLEAAGLLRGLPATTHHGAMEDLSALGVAARAARIVDAGSLLTAGGIASGLDLALWLIHRLFGPEAESAVSATLEYHRVHSHRHCGPV